MTNILILFTIKHLISLKKSMHLKNLFIAYRRIAKYYAPAFFYLSNAIYSFGFHEKIIKFNGYYWNQNKF